MLLPPHSGKQAMRITLLIAQKELLHMLNSVLGYVFALVFTVALPYPIFWAESKTNIFLNGQADLRVFFHLLPLVLLVFVPALAMRTWAEERHLSTIELLMSYPVRTSQWVVGKFLGNLAILWTCLGLTIVLPILVSTLGDLDWGPVVGGYLGAMFLGAACLSIAQCIGALSRHQILAFVLSFIILAFFMLFHLSTYNLQYRFLNVARGVIDSRDLLYYLSIVFVFLFLNVRLIDSKFWRN